MSTVRNIKENVENEIESADEIMRKQREEAEQEIEKPREEHPSQAGRVWELKKKIMGGKKSTQQAKFRKAGRFKRTNQRSNSQVLQGHIER